MNFEAIKLDWTRPVLQITLHRPELRNAMSLSMVAELREALRRAEASVGTADAVRAIVLRGAGGHFCAGGDIKDMAAARGRTGSSASDALAEVNAAFGALCVAYARTPLAVVAVLEGVVMGGGFGLACVADVALAAPSAVFRLPETSLGLLPAQIAPFLVERLGYSQARRLAVTGASVDAGEALRLGLVHGVHAPEALEEQLAAVLRDVLACAPAALAATKALLAQARLQDPADLVASAAAAFSRAALGPEGQEGMAAFLQKRKPHWAPL